MVNHNRSIPTTGVSFGALVPGHQGRGRGARGRGGKGNRNRGRGRGGDRFHQTMAPMVMPVPQAIPHHIGS